jgi:nitrile hydratase accessory protein
LNPPDEPVFAEPWEAEAFAMAVKLHEKGLFTWSEWAEALGAQIRSAPEQPYYACWLAALEHMVESRAVMSRQERERCIEAWDRAARETPHGKPIEISRYWPAPETSR